MKKLIIVLVSIVLVVGLLSMCNVTCATHFIMPLAGNARIIYKICFVKRSFVDAGV